MNFSIIIPLYNKEKYVAKTIRTILSQTFQEFEIVIVDDGSTDQSVNQVKKIDDNRIRIISQQNAGVSAARNRGIAEAKYDLIAFLDADDLWEKDFLETIMNLQIKYSSCSIFAVNYKVLSNDGKMKIPLINCLPANFKDGILQNYFEIASKSDPIICSISLAMKKDAIESIGGFPIGIRAGEDLLTWARLAARYDIAYSIEPKAVFNRLDEGINIAPRIPDEHDKVGQELRKLLTNNDQSRLKGLKDYIAYWHKIRMAIFIRLGKSKEAKREFYKMSEFTQKNLKFFIYALLIYSPAWMRKSLNSSLLQLNTYRRKLMIKSEGN
ncbi:MAG: glycosyltransferase family A protein [Sulfuricurvum sp.]|nr:glycosyltransferase family A protein [Sulfuricurvum sp.]